METMRDEDAVRELRRNPVPADQRLEKRARPAAEAPRAVAVEMDADGGAVQGRARRVSTRAGAASGDRRSIAGASAGSDAARWAGGTPRGRQRPAREGGAPVREGRIT